MTDHYAASDTRAEFERAFKKRWPLDSELEPAMRGEMIAFLRAWADRLGSLEALGEALNEMIDRAEETQ
jgi:hypothetical protein